MDVVPVYVGRAPMPEVVTRYFLDHYVTVCERFNFSTAESDYVECGAFHSAQRNAAWGILLRQKGHSRVGTFGGAGATRSMSAPTGRTTKK